MDTTLVRTAVKILTTLQGKMHDEWFDETGREFRWAADTLCHELQASEYFLEDFAPGKSKDPCPSKSHAEGIWSRVTILLDIAHIALETGYEHLVGKEIKLVFTSGEQANGKLKEINNGLLYLVDESGAKMTVTANSIAGTEINKIGTAQNS